jgi:phosphohistidine phosphatase
MKKLVLVRHAKSDWGKENLKDIDRHLNERGYEDAYLMSEWYTQHHSMPQLLVSSPATRAVSTAFIFARTFGIDESKVKLVKGIYESPASKVMETISGFSDEYSNVMLFGHNPGLTDLLNEVNKDLLFENISTCGIVLLEFDIDKWKDILNQKEARLAGYKFPKSFKQ